MKEKDNYMEKAIEWVKNKTSKPIKAVYDGFEEPRSFINQSTNDAVQPDLAFTGVDGSHNYTDIALKVDDQSSLVTRWKLLSTLAGMKHGKLHLLAPRGHKMFAQRLVKDYEIEAKIHSI